MLNAQEIKERMERVNDYWDRADARPGGLRVGARGVLPRRPGRLRGSREAGISGAGRGVAAANGWNFYDNGTFNTTNADNLSCGETYMDLMLRFGVSGDWTPMKRTMEFTAADPANDYWWWVDTMYMALNFYNRIGLYLGDGRLLDKAYRLFVNSKTERGCYDEEACLWFRDEDFLPEKARTRSGKKVFWSRGNGWVLAGLARTLRTLPADCRYRPNTARCSSRWRAPSAGARARTDSGRTSLLEPDEFPMPETSGTALNVLGLLIGVRLGLLGEDSLRCALRGFDALNREAVEPSGRIGWVQTVALKPGPVRKECTNDYAVGTYLLICRELLGWMAERNDGTL